MSEIRLAKGVDAGKRVAAVTAWTVLKLAKFGPSVIKLVASGLTTAALLKLIYEVIKYFNRSPWMQRRLQVWRAKAADHCLQRMNTMLRNQIQNSLVTVATRVRFEHPHPTSAEERNAASTMLENAINMVGRPIHYLSPSPRENAGRSGVTAERQYHGLADLRQPVLDTPPPPEAIIHAVDVDYYVEMGRLLGKGNAMLAYTFVPEEVAGVVPDGYFTIKDNKVVYRVNGGGTWTHPVWDYNHDVVYINAVADSALDTFYAMLADWTGGYFRRVVVAHVDQFRVSQHRRIVSVVPFAKGFKGLFEWSELGTELKRMEYQRYSTDGLFTTWNVIETIQRTRPANKKERKAATPGKVMLSFGREDSLAACTMARDLAEKLYMKKIISKQLFIADSAKFISDEIDLRTANVAHTAVITGVPLFANTVHAPGLLQQARALQVGSSAPHFRAEYPLEDENAKYSNEGKAYARRYAPAPLGDAEAVFPAECLANDVACIEGRLLQTQVNATVVVTNKYHAYAREFVEQIFLQPRTKGNTHRGRPLTVAEVAEMQTLPRQRIRNQQAVGKLDEDFLIKSFQKREPYGGVNHPRNISQVPTLHTLNLTRFTYRFKCDILKKLDWYMPCRTPREIAEAVNRLALEWAGDDADAALTGTDMSRFDGHINEFLRREVEFACYLRWVHPDHREELVQLLNAECNANGVTKNGLKYNAGCSRLSGSPLTTDGNTLINAFFMYCYRRNSCYDVGGAFDFIGLVYGDDGLTAGRVDDELLEETARALGLSAKVEEKSTRGPISFLARVFIDPWASPASIQSPKRTLLKLHTTCDTQRDLVEIGLAKTVSYSVSDAATPFIGDWCRAYQEAALYENPTLTVPHFIPGTDCRYVHNDPDMDVTDSWPQDPSAYEQMAYLVAVDLGIETGELEEHLIKLRAYRGPVEGLPQLMLAPASPDTDRIPASIDGELRRGDRDESQMPTIIDTSNLNVQDAEQANGSSQAGVLPPGSGNGTTGGGKGSRRLRSGNNTPPADSSARGGNLGFNEPVATGNSGGVSPPPASISEGTDSSVRSRTRGEGHRLSSARAHYSGPERGAGPMGSGGLVLDLPGASGEGSDPTGDRECMFRELSDNPEHEQHMGLRRGDGKGSVRKGKGKGAHGSEAETSRAETRPPTKKELGRTTNKFNQIPKEARYRLMKEVTDQFFAGLDSQDHGPVQGTISKRDQQPSANGSSKSKKKGSPPSNSSNAGGGQNHSGKSSKGNAGGPVPKASGKKLKKA